MQVYGTERRMASGDEEGDGDEDGDEDEEEDEEEEGAGSGLNESGAADSLAN